MDTGIVDGLPLLQKLALDSIPKARQACCVRRSPRGAKQQYTMLVCIVCSLDKMLPGLENTFCTQLQADDTAVHQPAAE